MTGFTAKQKRLIRERDENVRQLCRQSGEVVHHRAGRGMGGAKSANRVSNGCMLCNRCNVLIESDANYQAFAKLRGIKISKFSNPAQEPFFHHRWEWCLLLDDGNVQLLTRDEVRRG